MDWHRLGRIYVPEARHPWMATHAANPVAEHLEGDLFRIYFNCRDEKRRAHVAYVDMELGPPSRVERISERPVLAPGAAGLFDDSGVSLGCLCAVEGKKHLYYVGWNLGVTVPWRNSIGLAIYDEERREFARHGRAPILDRDEHDPFSLSYPFVMRAQDGYRMWYGSHRTWGPELSDMTHVLKYAESPDGVRWERQTKPVLAGPDKTALARPWILQDGDFWRMWYCYRGERYRIGYAESEDGISWRRMDAEGGLDVSPDGWDSEMVAYPCVFDHDGRRYMLYCGNGFGRSGFGLAVGV